MNYFQKKRQLWLHERIEPFNRKDLADYFGISIPQVSNDISIFMKSNPGIFKYNYKAKRYERQIRAASG